MNKTLIKILIGIGCFVIVIVVGSIFFFKNLISLKGDEVVQVALNSNYEEKGAKTNFIDDDNIKITGEVDNKKVGTYKIKYEVKFLGIKVDKYRTVEVVDREAPELTLKGGETVNVCGDAKYEEEGYTATDSYEGDLTDKVKVEEKDDIIFYTVEDNSGNKTTVRRYINRDDKEAPKLTLVGSSTSSVVLNSKYSDPGYKVSDNCSEKVDVKVEGKVDTSKTGNYTLTYTATDEAGNTTTVKRKVSVVKKTSTSSGSGSIPGNCVIYLTFDDGPSKTSTPKILEILKKKNVKATFFVINHSSSLDYLIKQEYQEGHTVALHSYTHNYKTVYSSKTAFYNDLKKIQDKVEKLTGVKQMITRFPGGSSNTVSRNYKKGIMSELTKEMKEKGYHYFDWNVSSGDAGNVKTSDAVYKNVTKGISTKRSNNVVLMHDFENNNKTVNALERIIDYGLAKGCKFDKIDMTTPMVTHGVNN